jgi:hypothetical protein
MPTVKVTERELDSRVRAALADKKAAYLWDIELRGFGCYVTPKGKVSFLFQTWEGGRGGKPNRFVIAHRPTSVEDARKLAEGFRAQADGSTPIVPPKQQRIALEREARAAKKLKDAWDEYYSEYPWKSDSHKDHARLYIEGLFIPSLEKKGKYPPAEPGALELEPPEAADGVADAAPKIWDA